MPNKTKRTRDGKEKMLKKKTTQKRKVIRQSEKLSQKTSRTIKNDFLCAFVCARSLNCDLGSVNCIFDNY